MSGRDGQGRGFVGFCRWEEGRRGGGGEEEEEKEERERGAGEEGREMGMVTVTGIRKRGAPFWLVESMATISAK